MDSTNVPIASISLPDSRRVDRLSGAHPGGAAPTDVVAVPHDRSMTLDSTTLRTTRTAPPSRGRPRRRATTALLATGLAAVLVGGAPADAGAGSGAQTATAARYLLPSGDAGGRVTRSDLLDAGILVHDFTAPTVRWGAGHRGVDLRATSGSPVVAPQSGTVAFVGVVVDRPLVVVTHADGLRSTLEPVTSELSTGTVVGQGEVVGSLAVDAGTHCAPDTCLHWGVRRGEEYVDPLALVGAREPVVLLPVHRR